MRASIRPTSIDSHQHQPQQKVSLPAAAFMLHRTWMEQLVPSHGLLLVGGWLFLLPFFVSELLPVFDAFWQRHAFFVRSLTGRLLVARLTPGTLPA